MSRKTHLRRFRKVRPPLLAWLVHLYGPPIDAVFYPGPFLEWRRSEAAAKKLVRQINAEGGRATLLGLYERKSTW